MNSRSDAVRAHVRLSGISGLCLLAFCAGSLVFPAYVSAEPSIRMYKVNKKKQQRRIVLSGKATKQPGCHNLLYGRNVSRVAQTGYAWCSLYTQDDCAEASILASRWTGDKYRKYGIDGTRPQPKLYPGSKWQPVSLDTAVQSWYCEAEPEK